MANEIRTLTRRTFIKAWGKENMRIGVIMRIHAGAQGIGYWDYEVTEVTKTHVTYQEVNNNVRELEEWEVI